MEIVQKKEEFSLRSLQALVNIETSSARDKFTLVGQNLEDMPLDAGFMGFVEEVGKLVRCVNKLRLSTDDQVIKEWRTELLDKFITTRSMLDRLYLTSRDRNK